MTSDPFRACLQSALNAVPGWRAEARRLLGVAVTAHCPVCRHPFERLGTQQKTCGASDCKRQWARTISKRVSIEQRAGLERPFVERQARPRAGHNQTCDLSPCSCGFLKVVEQARGEAGSLRVTGARP